MPYTLDISLALGTSKAGLTDLRAQLVDTAGANVGSAVSSGFSDMGQGNYLWHYASFPDGHRGGVKFYSNAAPSTTLAFAAINPEEAENVDTKVSELVASVWSHATRTLTSFGTLVSDIWAAATRTLTAFGFSVTLDLTQSVSPTLSGNTVGGALNAAHSNTHGPWYVVEESGVPKWKLYASDGTTLLHTFTLDSLTAPTQRT
jgi:hypothetical protein